MFDDSAPKKATPLALPLALTPAFPSDNRKSDASKSKACSGKGKAVPQSISDDDSEPAGGLSDEDILADSESETSPRLVSHRSDSEVSHWPNEVSLYYPTDCSVGCLI